MPIEFKFTISEMDIRAICKVRTHKGAGIEGPVCVGRVAAPEGRPIVSVNKWRFQQIVAEPLQKDRI